MARHRGKSSGIDILLKEIMLSGSQENRRVKNAYASPPSQPLKHFFSFSFLSFSPFLSLVLFLFLFNIQSPPESRYLIWEVIILLWSSLFQGDFQCLQNSYWS